MFASNLIIATGDVRRLRTLTIPVDGVEGDELFLGPLFQWDTKDFLQEIPLLVGNLRTNLGCNQNKH